MSGGASRIASSVTVYNTMLQRKPELVEALCGDYYRSRSSKISPGDLPPFKQPIFSFHEGYFMRPAPALSSTRRRSLRACRNSRQCRRKQSRLSGHHQQGRARHRLAASRHPVPEQFRDAAHPAQISRLAGNRAGAALAAAVALRRQRPADPESAARGPVGHSISVKGVQRIVPLEAEAASVKTVLYVADGRRHRHANRPKSSTHSPWSAARDRAGHAARRCRRATSVIVLRAERPPLLRRLRRQRRGAATSGHSGMMP